MNIDPATVFAALSNEVRLRCLYLLSRHNEVCVCDLVDALEIGQPTVSKALGVLKKAGLVKDRRERNWSYYRIHSNLPQWLVSVLEASIEELNSHQACISDNRRFVSLMKQPRTVACP